MVKHAVFGRGTEQALLNRVHLHSLVNLIVFN